MTNNADAALSSRTEIDVTEEPELIASADLFGGQNEVVIVHNGARYRLRITRQDKLILTK